MLVDSDGTEKNEGGPEFTRSGLHFGIHVPEIRTVNPPLGRFSFPFNEEKLR
jgi:hypothetical protein